MIEILFLEKLEGADVKYHSEAAFLNSSPNINKWDNFGPTFKKNFFARNITFWQIDGAEVKHDNSFLKF